MANAEKSTTAASLPLPSIGSYQLLEPLGSGGMSSVYKAIHTGTGHHVAVKVLPRSLAKNPTLLQRFLREAKSAESLEHPNIVAIYDRGAEGGRYYLVLEYVEGSDLHDYVRSKGPMPVRQAVEIIKAVAEGLSHAAGRGLIHRDIKPANLLLDLAGHVKITDLGLALQIDEEDERVTRDGTTVGTVDYMSPDQARDSRGTSARSDIYSLGCTFYFLLTGTPPFPGGDLPDKLRRHAQEPPPSVRVTRPDVPEALSRLIQKMMAKKPEGRFADYEKLIAALDAIPLDGSSSSAPEIAMALIDDEDDGDADEDSDDAIVLTVAEPTPAKSPGSKGRDSSRLPIPTTPPVRDEASLAELAALDDDVPVTPRRRSKQAAPLPTAVLASDDIFAPVGAVVAGSRRVEEKSVKDYILKGLMFGVAIVLVGFAVQQAFVALNRPPEAPVEDEEFTEQENSSEGEFVPVPFVRVPVKSKAEELDSPVAPAVAWQEPTDPAPQLPADPVFPGDVSRLAPPPWATSKVEVPAGGVTVIRRVDPLKGGAGRMTIARAFDRPEPVVELADDGPFYERDIRFGTSARLLRARPGFRPIVVLEPATTAHIKEQTAPFVLDGHDLTLEGIDLVVEAGPGDMPAHQSALFSVRSGMLTLRDCTITVVGTQAASLALVSIDESTTRSTINPPRVRIDRTLVRGPSLALAHLGAGRGELVATRCVVLSGDSASVTITARGKGPRRVEISRSVLASRRAFLDDASLTGVAPTIFKLLGNTFARIEGGSQSSLIHVQLQDVGSTDPRRLMDWNGDSNSFVGWSEFLTAGGNRSVKLASLDDLRRSFARSEIDSRETAAPWPATAAREWTTPAFLEPLAPEAIATLRGVATGNPFLLERSLGVFPRLLVPETVPLPTPPVISTAKAAKSAKPKIQLYAETKVAQRPVKPVKPAAEATAPAGPLDLAFDLQDPAYAGDLGRFVTEQLADGQVRPHVRIVATGQGTYPCTPFNVPAGTLLEIFVQPVPGANPPVWSVPSQGNAEALISAKGADLTILGGRFVRDGGSAVKTIVRVEDGLLTLAHCWLFAPGVVAEGGGGLIHIGSTGSRPLTPRDPNAPPIPVARLTDCVLITGGTTIRAELGLGVVSLTNCALASGGDAIVLNPAKVARFRFAVDLWLNRCTFLAERSFVRLGRWQGTDPGPDRPWLVSSRDCAFLDPFDRGATPRQTAVLLDDPNGLSRGTLVWQSGNDAYDVAHFTLMAGSPLPGVNKPDIQREWVAFWGRSHIGRVFGPLRNAPATVHVKLLHERPKPGTIVPADFALDEKYAKSRKTTGIGADIHRLGIQVPQTPATR